MKNFKFLKPAFTVGMLVLLSFLLIANLLIFKYIVGAGMGAAWFVAVEELSVILGYVVAKGFGNSDSIPWSFARKWWPEEETK